MADDLAPGALLQGRYRVEAPLASGAQGHVYRARHIELDRPVAVKLLRAHNDPKVSAQMTLRFEQEARLISGLRDPHTITLYDFGRLESGSLFMVFEYIDGMSLKELLAAEGAIAPHRVAKILRQTLSSLHEAHSFGVLHRDIKPANIMLFEHAGRPDQVKLLDFGIAKILRDPNTPRLGPMTDLHHHIGTPRYMPPELLHERPATPASDLYSLGLVAYELLIGAPAIKANATLEIYASLLSPQSLSLPQELPIPRGLRLIVDRMMLKEPGARYQEADAVQRDLARWMSVSGVEFDSLQGSDFQDNAAFTSQARVLKPSKKIRRKIDVFAPQMIGEDLIEMSETSEPSDTFNTGVPTHAVSHMAAPAAPAYGAPPLLSLTSEQTAPHMAPEAPAQGSSSVLPWVIVAALVVLVVVLGLILAVLLLR